ncbi:KR domain-containing protein [Mesorhizobium plurifarium]|uniref:SDR family oxidoreductase n=1 Tax=Sinorhizobium arboris TaxID=76745 RepID=UPI0004842A99|nr:SDR family oxidoreductase [Sinorhizobium arboris]PST27284.1 KR domain-containing protein [Mesorhizobium plurifarium]
MTHVIITGASSGIGLAVASAYASRGAKLSLVARSRDVLEQAAQKLMAEHGVAAGAIRTEAADVSREEEIKAAIFRCVDAFGPCDILVTSAGIVEPGPFEALQGAAFHRQIDTNFSGTVHAVRAVYPDMKRRRSGHILMVSSGAGLIGIYGYTAYCASKFALNGFAQALRSEARANNVGISICFPPDTETPQFKRELAARPKEARVVMGTVRPWTAEAVARKIVKGIDRRRFEIYFGATLYLLGRFGPAVRPLIDWWFDRAIARNRAG